MSRLHERRAAKSTAVASFIGTDLFVFYVGYEAVRCEWNRYFDRCFHHFMRVILFVYFWIRPTSYCYY
jgi:hypothetical protein